MSRYLDSDRQLGLMMMMLSAEVPAIARSLAQSPQWDALTDQEKAEVLAVELDDEPGADLASGTTDACCELHGRISVFTVAIGLAGSKDVAVIPVTYRGPGHQHGRSLDAAPAPGRGRADPTYGGP
jgi:hypothetical protein